MSLRRFAVRALPLAALLLFVPVLLQAWGFWAHPRINRAAVLMLPAEMLPFFYDHIDFLTEEAAVPDLRKHVLEDRAEGPRHFVDIENYDGLRKIARTPTDAKIAYPAAKLDQDGRLPWYLLDVLDKLTEAMRSRNKPEILFLAADLGHYIGDAHMPLHASANFDGQLTDQKGIHALWEARLPEQFGKNYNLRVSEPKPLADPTAEIWRIITESHLAADTLLSVDKKLRREIGPDNLYEKDPATGTVRKNRYGQPYFSQAYVVELNRRLNGMVERRLRGAIQATANFWLTAWANAGRPDLTHLDSDALRAANAVNLATEKELMAQGKLIELSSHAEY